MSGRSVVVNANTLTVKRAGVVLIEAFQSGNENYEAASTVQYLTIIDTTKRNQSITFTPIPNDTLHSEGDSVRIMLTATASSSLPLQFVVGADTNFLDRNSYRITTYGTYTITALQDGDSVFNPAPPVSRTFTVKRKQSMIFSEIAQKNYESTPFFINAYTNAALNIEFSLSNDSIITLDPDYLVTIKNVGTVGITAKQKGNDEYYATDSITRILVVAKADQYFVFKPIPSKIYKDPPIPLPATTHAGLNIMYSSASHLVEIQKNTISIRAGGGIATITAFNTGNNLYNALPPTSRTFRISKAMQSISFSQIENKVYGSPPFVLQANSSAGLPIFFFASNTLISIDNNTVTIKGAGTVGIIAYQTGNENYLSSNYISQIFTIHKINQKIRFGDLANKTYGDNPFVLQATSSAGLPVFFSASNTLISIHNNTVFLNQAGKVSITAYSLENDTIAFGYAIQIFTIHKANQSIIFEMVTDKTFGDSPFVLQATSSAGLPVFFSVSNTLISIRNNTVSLNRAGEVSITAYSLEDDNVNFASATQPFTVQKAAQSIDLGKLKDITFADIPFLLNASSSAGLPVLYSVSNTLITIHHNEVIINEAGTVSITAYQRGNENYLETSATHIITTSRFVKHPTFLFFHSIPTLIVGQKYVLSTTSNSPVLVRYASAHPNRVKINEDTLIAISEGIALIYAEQIANSRYQETSTTRSVEVISTGTAIISHPLTFTETPNTHIRIFPNPADDYMTIQWDKSQNVSSIRLYDVKGNEVSDRVWGIGYGVSIDIKTMPKGEYIVVVYGGKGEILKTEKVIKN